MVEKGQTSVFKFGCEIESSPVNYRGRSLAKVVCRNCDARPEILSEDQSVESAVGKMAGACTRQYVVCAPEGAVLDSVVRGDGSYELIAVTEELDGPMLAPSENEDLLK